MPCSRNLSPRGGGAWRTSWQRSLTGPEQGTQLRTAATARTARLARSAARQLSQAPPSPLLPSLKRVMIRSQHQKEWT